jgi:hypothetical protein
MIGMTLPPPDAKPIVEEQVEADLILKSILKPVTRQKTVVIEYCLPIAGKEVWLPQTILPLSEETVILVAQDISDRKKAEEALRL